MYGVKPNVVKANGVKVNVLRGKVVNGNSGHVGTVLLC